MNDSINLREFEIQDDEAVHQFQVEVKELIEGFANSRKDFKTLYGNFVALAAREFDSFDVEGFKLMFAKRNIKLTFFSKMKYWAPVRNRINSDMLREILPPLLVEKYGISLEGIRVEGSFDQDSNTAFFSIIISTERPFTEHLKIRLNRSLFE